MLTEKAERIQAGLLALGDQVSPAVWALIRPCVVDQAGLVEQLRELEQQLEVPQRFIIAERPRRCGRTWHLRQIYGGGDDLR
ncbi:MAG: hypothetical protein ACNI3A_18615 [Desulfovibrio sp.]|uniref:hypothetical protein n=1 Tax=Desulfovibrio sp. 7SRBS1 TaxID=3378064 RepID=UPI003B3CDA7D